MSKLDYFYNTEKYSLLKKQIPKKWWDNVLKVCPSVQWSLDRL